jgi:hypothetical protein
MGIKFRSKWATTKMIMIFSLVTKSVKSDLSLSNYRNFNKFFVVHCIRIWIHSCKITGYFDSSKWVKWIFFKGLVADIQLKSNLETLELYEFYSQIRLIGLSCNFI